MAQVRVRAADTEHQPVVTPFPVLRPTPVMVRPRRKAKDEQTAQARRVPQTAADQEQQEPATSAAASHTEEVREHLVTHQDDPRFQHELKEMQEVHDLDEIDDDVEAEATLLEWRASEHTHRPKSPVWYVLLAAGTTLVVGIQLFMFNFFGALTIGLVGAMIYYIAQQKPEIVRYRIMLDGIAINNLLYHWQDLATFNVIYEPGECKTVIFRSERQFSPYIHMEIDDADPVAIRDVLIEFLPEDQDMHEPLSDLVARRLGF